MKRRLAFSLPLCVALMAVWLLLHGEWSIANLVGGAVLGVTLTFLFPVDDLQMRHRIHPWQFIKMVVFVLYSLVLSSWAVIKVILRPTPTAVRSGIVRVRLSEESQLTTTLVANFVTLTPGTMTLTARLDPSELHIHVLGLADTEEFRASVHDLERRVVAAITPIAEFGGPDTDTDLDDVEDFVVNVVTGLAIGMLTLASAICFVRAMRPGTIVDRAIALDGVVSAMICGIGIAAVRIGSGDLIDISLVGGLLGFMTLATVARYVGRRGL